MLVGTVCPASVSSGDLGKGRIRHLVVRDALHQFLPVALGEPIRSVRAAHVGFCLYVPGFTGFVTGLLSGSATLMTLGALPLGAGVLVFAANLADVSRWWCPTAARTRQASPR